MRLLHLLKIMLLILIFCVIKCTVAASKPHIIFILADDLGWNDVGFHGSTQIPTPNIDALAYSGLILNNYYVMHMCTPSRSALMTGKHPIHTGMQHFVLLGAEPRGLPLGEKLLPEYLKELGYRNHIVGKWHLGFYKKQYTPLYRGFESHLGFWTGHHDYNDHIAMEIDHWDGFYHPQIRNISFFNEINWQWGLDMRDGMNVSRNLHGQYSTDIFTKAAEKIIADHNATEPLFLYLAHAAVHSGNSYNPLPTPDAYAAKFLHIEDYNRRRFAGVLTKLDESVGRVVQALKSKNMLENSIIVFSTDNGGAAGGFNINAASNWPLRGVKNTLWEGGVRGTGLIWSASIEKSRRVAQQTMHITDWLPTLYYAAGGNMSNLKHLDGLNVWEALMQDHVSPRDSVLHNIDNVLNTAALTVGKWKIIKGISEKDPWNLWHGPSGRSHVYNVSEVLHSFAGAALQSLNKLAAPDEIMLLQKSAEVHCDNLHSQLNTSYIPCQLEVAACLFNIEEDPCEKNNLADIYPDKIQELAENLAKWNATYVKPGNLPSVPEGNPKFWDYTWTNFGDYS